MWNDWWVEDGTAKPYNVEDFKAVLKGKQGGVMLEGVYPDRPGSFYYAFGM